MAVATGAVANLHLRRCAGILQHLKALLSAAKEELSLAQRQGAEQGSRLEEAAELKGENRALQVFLSAAKRELALRNAQVEILKLKPAVVEGRKRTPEPKIADGEKTGEGTVAQSLK